MSVGPDQSRSVDGDPVVPLVVDLDETLVRSDLLVETGLAYLARGPRAWWATGRALLSGKAVLKATIAKAVLIDPALLPYNADVLKLMADARSAGRPVYIASASHETYVAAVAAHLGLEGWLASSSTENLLGATKRTRLVERFGIGGFDYVGDSRSDLDVWPAARRAIAIGPSASTRRQLAATHQDVTVIPALRGGWRAWWTLLRPVRWVPNALIFVPMLVAQRLDATSLLSAAAAFIALSILVSSLAILTDIIDIGADRHHPTERLRPLASGLVSVKDAVLVAPALTLLGAVAAAVVSWTVMALVAGWFALSLVYLLAFRRNWLIGMVAAAALCTMRILIGAAAVGIAVSPGILGVATLAFAALVVVERVVERTLRPPSIES
jgi:phosphoserine phosphatase